MEHCIGKTVIDGTVEFTGEIVMDVYGSIKPKLTINGGNLSVTNWRITTACAKLGGKPAVKGGTFTSAVPAEYCAEGFIPTEIEAGKYGVKAEPLTFDEDGICRISTEAELKRFAAMVNEGNNFAGKTVHLENDINLNNELWTPIGVYKDSKTHFKGTFDGQNHTITGLKVNESRKNGVGFFGKVYTGTIKNLTVEGTVSTSNSNYVGGIVGHGYATITNCTFKGTVGSKDTMQVGGIAGSGGFTITNCSVYGDVIAGCWAGGIVGNCQDGGAYTNCYVVGTISSESTYWGGGAAGITPVPLYPSQKISQCYSDTVVKVAGKEVNCPIIAAYNNPLDYNGYTGDLKIYDNSWNKAKNSNNSYPIYAEKNGEGGVLEEGKDVSRDNALIMLEGDLNYIRNLPRSKIIILPGSAVTAEVIDNMAVAAIDEEKYFSLAAAIAAAKDGETVKLLADIDLDEQIATGKAITIDGQGKYTIKATKKLVGTSGKAGMFYRTTSAQGTLTFLNVTLDGNGVSKIFLNEGGAGETVFDGVTSKNGGGIAYGTGIHISGGGSHATIRNSTLTGSTGTMELNDTNYYAANDLWVGGNVYVTVENSIIGTVFVNSAPTATATNGVVHGQLTITGENTKITYLSGEEESADKLDKFGNNGSLVKIDSGSVDTISDKGSYAISGGTFKTEIKPEYCAEGFIPQDNGDGTYGVKVGVAEVNGVKYETLQAAIDAAARNATVTLLANTKENVTIAKALTLDLNGYTINGGTVKGKPAVTVTARVTIKDSSEAQTGTIMREDTAENSGVSSHYVIDVQGGGWLMFEGGNVINHSGVVGVKGASLVRIGDDSIDKYPGLTIKGGTFTQDNFIVIKVDRGYFTLNGGTLNSANTYAIENWFRATVKNGTVNGAVSSWTYPGGSNSTLEISGGTINGDVTSVNYGNTTDKKATVSVTGGTVNGELDTRSYNPATGDLTSINDAAKATIEVSGGTFSTDPTKYVVEESAIIKNENGTYGVEKAYLARVGNTSYYTMDEAFKAQTASGKAIVMLRDYTTGSTFNSGSINREVDLNGHTWTCTSTDMNSAAFEINYPNVTLTVKNGKIISNTLVGLIPSAMGGTIKYDNSGLIFEGVEMTSNGGSGIETNGNNTNDSVTLINSTLNVPNGFGIYFPSSGTLTINNSTITAKTMGVQVCSGKLNINAGSAITVNGDAVPKAENDGAIQDGAAISVVNRAGYKGLSDIVITGGKFTAKAGNKAIKAYDWANKVESEFTKADLVAVSGGTFSSEVNKDYLADRFVVNKNTNGTYGVTAGSGFVGANVVVTESLAMKVVVGTASKYVVVTYKGLDGIAKTVRFDKFTDIKIEDKDYKYCLFDQIMPQMIDVKFSFELYGENDVMLDRKANYSVVDYLAHIIASDKDSVAFRNVAASLIEYANRAKVVKGLATIAPEFVKGTEKVDLTELYKTFIADEKNKIPAKDTVKAEDISKGDAQVIYKAKVVFDDAYTLKFYTNAGDGYTYTLSKNGSTEEEGITFDKNGEFTINVLAQDITTQYVIKVYGEDKSNPIQTVTYGVSTYCIRMQETKTPQGELYVASYYYGVAVQQYGAANTASVQG